MQALGYKQVSDGVWEPPVDGAKPPKNFDPAALREAPGRRSRMIKPWRDAMLALSTQSGVASAEVEDIHDRILLVDPDDAEVHTLRGEVRMKVTVDKEQVERWVLAETAQAKERRKALKDFVKKALEVDPKPDAVLPSAEENALELDWTVVLVSPVVRVLTTGERREAENVLKVASQVQSYVRFALGAASDYQPNFTIYLLTKAGEEQTFAQKHPKVTDALRAFWPKVKGTGLPACGDAVWWDDDPSRRLDGVTRHTLGTFLTTTFSITTVHGWAWEGLGLYLTRELVGTRLTWYVQPTGDEPADRKNLRAKLLVSDTNWMDEAYKVMSGPKSPGLESVMQHNVNTMSVEEMLVAYALAAFFVEAKPAELPRLLHQIGSGVRYDTAVQVALGMEVDRLEQRLRRWLEERR
jgi:hypothetical protein